MKIYLGTHKAYFQKQVSLGNLPLSFVYNDERDKNITVSVKDEFNEPYKKVPVYPHQIFPSNDFMLFDNAEKPITDSRIYFQVNDAGEYEALPEYVTEFYPKEFIFDLLLRRADQYNKTTEYKINFDFTNITDKKIRNSLLSVIQNAETHRQYPSNIIFNGGEVEIRAAEAPEQSDFVFLKSVYVTSESVKKTLAEHKNVWICYDELNDCIKKNGTEEDGKYTLSRGQIFSAVSGQIDPIEKNGTAYAFIDSTKNWIDWTKKSQYLKQIKDKQAIIEDNTSTEEQVAAAEAYIQTMQNQIKSLEQQAEEYEHVTGFFLTGSPLAIYHKKDSGYIIISHNSFLQNLNSGSENKAALRLFLETMLYVYLNGYCTVGQRTSFITDEAIDYYIHTAKRYFLPHPKISLIRLLQSADLNTSIKYQIVTVNTAPKEELYQSLFRVEYLGLDRFNNLLFEKKALTDTKDPSKGNNMLIYTMDRTLAIYDPEKLKVWEIESGVSIRKTDDETIYIAPILSSRHQIWIPRETVLSLPITGEYILWYEPESNKLIIKENIPQSDSDEETEEEDKKVPIPLADIKISVNEEIDYKDIRIAGGGESSAEPNYEMIDTGNIYGRPYRYGCPMIIRLPERYKPMQKEIRSEIEKHITSGDYPIILYKE